ncbi:MAG TPA: biopolymer transporter ExbD [Candidatus Omnitrophota bacterium]|nr:biopolymer transporter ExbD [Candidatus Omnitrophota bacterium]HRZ14535.1 biopolymer transporter ExbD [Candidatus Omnitrophota bacterium]
MKIAPRRTYFTMLESVAMTDIVLNMFIFFFISFSLLYTFNPMRVQKLEVKLPKAANTSNLDKINQVNITLTNEGMIYLDQEAVNTRALRDKLRQAQRTNPELTVILRADRLVSFKHIVNILDLLTELGVANLHIAAVKE